MCKATKATKCKATKTSELKLKDKQLQNQWIINGFKKKKNCFSFLISF